MYPHPDYSLPAPNLGIHRLRCDFKEGGLTLTAYAAAAKVDRSVLARILKAEREPSLRTGLKLAGYADFKPWYYLFDQAMASTAKVEVDFPPSERLRVARDATGGVKRPKKKVKRRRAKNVSKA